MKKEDVELDFLEEDDDNIFGDTVVSGEKTSTEVVATSKDYPEVLSRLSKYTEKDETFISIWETEGDKKRERFLSLAEATPEEFISWVKMINPYTGFVTLTPENCKTEETRRKVWQMAIEHLQYIKKQWKV